MFQAGNRGPTCQHPQRHHRFNTNGRAQPFRAFAVFAHIKIGCHRADVVFKADIIDGTAFDIAQAAQKFTVILFTAAIITDGHRKGKIFGVEDIATNTAIANKQPVAPGQIQQRESARLIFARSKVFRPPTSANTDGAFPVAFCVHLGCSYH